MKITSNHILILLLLTYSYSSSSSSFSFKNLLKKQGRKKKSNIYCQNLSQTFDEISKNPFLSRSFLFIKVNCSLSSKVCLYFKVNRYPSLKVFLIREGV